jgi:hypothetical protein
VWGGGNIDADPSFGLPGDYHQLNSSPCIDAGTNTPIGTGGLPTTDVYGRPRSQDGDGNGSTIADMGAYEFEYDSNTPIIAISQEFFEFYNFNNQPNPNDQYLSIRNCAGGTLNWEISDDSFWLEAVPDKGSSTGEINEVIIRVDTTTLSHGEYTCELTIFDANAINSPRTVLIKLHVADDMRVPEDFLTIQEAIDAVGDGSTIIVADGVYTGTGNKNIRFKGKAITVRSENGPANCIIDCENNGRGFIFGTYEEYDSVLDGFTIINGYSTGFGGGICIGNSSPKIINCKVINCQSTAFYGGGIYCFTGSPIISHCEIKGNSSDREGGGIHLNKSTPAIIENCTIVNNSAKKGGGVTVRNDNGYFATIRNCLIRDNYSYSVGGGVLLRATSTRIYNCTVVNNEASVGGGICFDCTTNRTPTLKNSILWNNTPDQIYYSYPVSRITYNDVQGGWSGTGNIDADPLFVDAANNDYYLHSDSPCINSGDPDYIPEPNETDLDGNPRIFNNRIDMGAYEYIFNNIPIADAGPDQITYTWFDCFAQVILDGTDSYDPDGDELTYSWTWVINGEVHEANGVNPSIQLPLGEHTIKLIVNDGTEDSEPDQVIITVLDNTPPELELSVSPTVLWPPNHKMVLVTPTWMANDNCDESPEVSLISITMNEEDNGKGDGNTTNDIQIGEDGSIYLRAERSGKGNNRVYTITYQAVDASGNVSQANATVTIPHDRR